MGGPQGSELWFLKYDSSFGALCSLTPAQSDTWLSFMPTLDENRFLMGGP